jgi:hypothetical protein
MLIELTILMRGCVAVIKMSLPLIYVGPYLGLENYRVGENLKE